MALAKSTVQVSIVSRLGQGFGAAFQTADARMRGLKKSVEDASRVVGNIDAFRKQQEAVKQSGYAWQAAKIKADQFRQALAAQESPTRKQAAELTKLERAADRAGQKFAVQRTRLADMGRELQQAGVNAGKLSAEYQRLTAQLGTAEAKHLQLEQSLRRQQSIVSAMRGTWSTIASTAAGVTAGAAVLAQPMRKAMTYDQQLSYMADTATGGEGREKYKANKAQISAAIDAALKQGGGKREDAASALNTMIASGKFTLQEALQQLPGVGRTAFASGASADDIAKTSIALKNYGIQDPAAEFDKLLRAGQLGNFELKDMARYLPSQLAMASAAGFKGQSGLTDLLAFNQVAMKTAGTQDEAGNNVINLLQKFSSKEFSKSMADNVKVQKGDPTQPGKKGKEEFDWAGYAIQQREKGVTQIDAFAALMERELAGNKQYQELQKRIASAGTDGEKKQTLEAMTSIAEGSQMGRFIADRQALLAALASVYGKKEMGDLKQGIGNADGAVAKSSENIRGETWSKATDAKNSVDRANEQAYNAVSGPLGLVLEAGTGLATQFPMLTAAAYSATVALGAMAAAAAAGGLAGKLTGGAAGAARGGIIARTTAAGAAMASKAGSLLKGGAIAGGIGFGADYAAGKFGVGKGHDEAAIKAQDDANWQRASTGEKIQSSVGRAIEGIGSLLFLDNIAREARAKRVANESAYLNGKQAVAAGAAAPVAAAAAAPAFKQTQATPAWAQGQPPVQNPLADKVVESSTAATAAAKAASEAATAAQNRPNVITQHNSYSVSVTANDTASIGAQMEQMLRTREKQKEAELRASFVNQPRY